MGWMRSPRQSVHYEERGQPGRGEHLIAEEERVSLHKQQNDEEEQESVMPLEPREESVSRKKGRPTVLTSLRKLKTKNIC